MSSNGRHYGPIFLSLKRTTFFSMAHYYSYEPTLDGESSSLYGLYRFV